QMDIRKALISRHLVSFCYLPRRVELVEPGMRDVNPALPRHFLNLLKPALEFGVCLVERDRCMNAGVPAKIDDPKQKIADLRLEGVMTLVEQRRCARLWCRRVL